MVLPDDLTEEEFGRWRRPKDAVAELMAANDWAKDQAVRTILTRLSAGLVRACTDHMIIKPRQGEEERGRRILTPQNHWNAQSQWLPDAYFWDTGDVYFDLRKPAGDGFIVTARVSYFGVRFDPAAIDEMLLTQPTVTAPKPQEAGRKPLPEALLEKWGVLFNEAYPSGSEALARSSVEGMFPDKSVTRDRLRRILPERKRGRPKENQ